MSDIPSRVDIQEEGPREGFQFEKGPIPTARKVALIDALSETGLKEIQVGSFVNPKRVPGWADVDDVVAGIQRKDGVRYTGLWLNERGLQRAIAVQQSVLQVHDSFTRQQPDTKFFGVAWLAEKIVGSRFHGFDKVVVV